MAHADAKLRRARKPHQHPRTSLLTADDKRLPRHHDEALQAPHRPEPKTEQDELINGRHEQHASRIAERTEKEIHRHHDDERIKDRKRYPDKNLAEAFARKGKQSINTKKDADQNQIHRHHLKIYLGGKCRRINGQHRLQSEINGQRRQGQDPAEEHDLSERRKLFQHEQHPFMPQRGFPARYFLISK